MKRVIPLLFSILAYSATPTRAQSMGTLTENGTSMEVKAAVAVLNDKPALVIYLLPFHPTAEEVAKLQAGDKFWMLTKASPDAKKWKTSPVGELTLSWALARESVGDARKAFIHIYTLNVGAAGSEININGFGTGLDTSVTGSVKVGQEVTLRSKGSQTPENTAVEYKDKRTAAMSWDLTVRARILAVVALKPTAAGTPLAPGGGEPLTSRAQEATSRTRVGQARQ